jgi:hypothetical protein
LKDILKNKREKSGYKPDKSDPKVDKYESYHYYGKEKPYGASQLMAKYYKNNPNSISQGYLK